MTATISPDVCLHCDSPLAARERQDGWCETCGKRLPPSQRLPKPGPARKAEPAPDGAEAALSVFGWALVISAVVAVLTGVGFHASASAIAVSTTAALILTLPVMYVLARRSPVARAVGLVVYAVVDFTLNATCCVLQIFQVFAALG